MFYWILLKQAIQVQEDPQELCSGQHQEWKVYQVSAWIYAQGKGLQKVLIYSITDPL